MLHKDSHNAAYRPEPPTGASQLRVTSVSKQIHHEIIKEITSPSTVSTGHKKIEKYLKNKDGKMLAVLFLYSLIRV